MIFLPFLIHQLLINEVLYDTVGKDYGCFVEIIGQPGMSLDGYLLVGIDGDTGKEYNIIDLSSYKIPQTGFFVVAQDDRVPNASMVDAKADYQNGPDNIELRYIDEKVDSVGYGDFSEAIFTGEGNPAFDISGYSIGRRPDGLDSNNNSLDFVGLAIFSPGAANMPKEVKQAMKIWKWGSIRRD